MVKTSKGVVAALVLGSLIAGLTGCRKEGPAERAGKEIDRSAEKVGKEIEKAGEKMKDVLSRIRR